MNATRENVLSRLLSFTVVVIANGHDVYSLFLAYEIFSFVPYNICIFVLMCVMYFVGM